MSETLVFYTHPVSRGRVTRWMLEEIGQPYDTVLLDYGTSMKSPAYLAVNPMGKVPAIVHRGVVVTESAAICAYLADAFPQANLAPATDDPLRGVYYRWLFFGAAPLEAAATFRSLGYQLQPAQETAVGFGRLTTVLDTLEQALADNDYLVGNRFTAADVYVGSQLGWSMMFGTIEKRPVFEQYYARLQARPAAQRAAQIDDASMAKQKV